MKRIALALSLALGGCITIQAPAPASAPAPAGVTAEYKSADVRPSALFFLALCATSYHSAQLESEKQGDTDMAGRMERRANWFAGRVAHLDPSDDEIKAAIVKGKEYVSTTTDFAPLGKACADFYTKNVGEGM